MSTRAATKPTSRASSDERREQVIAAAVKEFAASGYHAASTTAIAKRAGISQPYIYALFPNKRELFLAANKHVVNRIRRTFEEAARGEDGADAKVRAMGVAYFGLLEDRDEVLFQLQAHAAAGDPSLLEPVRDEFLRLYDDVSRMTGASRDEVNAFMASGMLLNVVAALDLPMDYCPGYEEPADEA